jgi:hypothetical protein
MATLVMLGWVKAATLRKYLRGNHLVVNLGFGCGIILLIELGEGVETRPDLDAGMV